MISISIGQLIFNDFIRKTPPFFPSKNGLGIRWPPHIYCFFQEIPSVPVSAENGLNIGRLAHIKCFVEKIHIFVEKMIWISIGQLIFNDFIRKTPRFCNSKNSLSIRWTPHIHFIFLEIPSVSFSQKMVSLWGDLLKLIVS